MTFSTMTFLIFFLPTVILLYFVCPSKWLHIRNVILLIASVFFYAWGEPIYVFLIVICIGFTYALSWAVVKRKKWGLLLAIIVNLLPLVVFKYGNFIISNTNSILKTSFQEIPYLLPIGISFYTFQIITYIVDLYKGKVEIQKNPLYLTLYVFFFPQLIAGPIVRYCDIEKQITNRKSTWKGVNEGFFRFIVGLSKKMLIANQAGMAVEIIGKQMGESTNAFLAWLCVIAYSIQILFDFSGYSDMAIGLGRIFGFKFLENFNKPYIAITITDFWRRWHMSLSGFFRDYMYIPLGGNRVSKIRNIFNLFVIWFLTGLWHGAFWNYVLWGLYYFVLLVGEKYVYGKWFDKFPYIVKRIVTFFLIVIGWSIFMYESNSIVDVVKHVGLLFQFGVPMNWISLQALEIQGNIFMVLIGLIIALVPDLEVVNIRSMSQSIIWILMKNIVMLILLLLCIVTIVSESFNPFIYFRF